MEGGDIGWSLAIVTDLHCRGCRRRHHRGSQRRRWCRNSQRAVGGRAARPRPPPHDGSSLHRHHRPVDSHRQRGLMAACRQKGSDTAGRSGVVGSRASRCRSMRRPATSPSDESETVTPRVDLVARPRFGIQLCPPSPRRPRLGDGRRRWAAVAVAAVIVCSCARGRALAGPVWAERTRRSPPLERVGAALLFRPPPLPPSLTPPPFPTPPRIRLLLLPPPPSSPPSSLFLPFRPPRSPSPPSQELLRPPVTP